jgi:hypothetical protein
MLRLCPNDNMGQRFWLGSLLIHCGRHADALYFAQQWLGDEVRKTGKTLTLGGCTFSAPQNELPESTLDETSFRWASGEILYTAALASFKLFGDIPISRTYLKLAATSNPHILLKILASVKKPRAFSSILLIKVLIFTRLISEPQQRTSINEWTRRSPRLSLAYPRSLDGKRCLGLGEQQSRREGQGFKDLQPRDLRQERGSCCGV